MFDVDRVVAGRIPLGDDQCRFDSGVFEKTVKQIIRDSERTNNENCLMDFESSATRTFVVAKKAVDAAAPTVFRSYTGQGVRATRYPLWQTARATTAAPSFFKPMYIDNPRPGIRYIDGGVGLNNPSQIALTEADRIWPTSTLFCLVSIGTGKPKATSFMKSGIADSDIQGQQSILRQVISTIPRIATYIPGWESARNLPPGVHAIIKIAGALAEIATGSEEVHQQIERDSHSMGRAKRFPYFRFNVERNLGDIGLEDWSKEEEIAAYTSTYMEEYDTKQRRLACTRCLVDTPSFSST